MFVMVRIAAVAVLLAGCLEPSTVTCADGRTCPIASVCDEVHATCVLPEQVSMCAGAADGTTCSFQGRAGECDQGVCLPSEVCGDGEATGSEQCDGADVRGATCSDFAFYSDPSPVTCTSSCTFDTAMCQGPHCGDGVPDGDFGEQCDAGLAVEVARCEASPFNFYDPGSVTCNAICRFDTTNCTGWCGDGIIDPTRESCDTRPAAGASCLDFGFGAGRLSCGLASCGTIVDHCAPFGWRVEPSIPTSFHQDIVAFGIDDLYTGNLIGALMHWDGANWTIDVRISGAISDVFGTSPTDLWFAGADSGNPRIWSWDGTDLTVYLSGSSVLTELKEIVRLSTGEMLAVGLDGAMYRKAPAAATWSSFGSGTTADLYGAWADATGRAFIVGDNAILRYQSGAIAPMILPGPGPVNLRAVWGIGATLFAVGQSCSGAACESVVLRGDGSTWTRMATPTSDRLASVWGRAADDVFAAGDSTVLHYDGISWMPMLVPEDVTALRGIAGTATGGPIAIGASGDVIRYVGSGSGPVQSGGVPEVRAAWARSASDIYAVAGQSVYHFDGTRWAEAYGAGVVLRGIFGVGTQVYAVGDGGTIAHYNGSWTAASAAAVSLRAVWATGADTFIVGDGGTILRGSGTTFAAMTSPVTTSLHGVFGFAPNDVYAVGVGGVVLHFDGAAWSQMASAITIDLAAVWGSGPADVFAVGRSGTVIHFDGTSWRATQVAPVVDLHGVYGTASDDVFAVGDHGAIVHFDGVGWGPLETTKQTALHAIVGERKRLVAVGRDTISGEGRWIQLARWRPWSCRASEITCSDGVDDDCDGAVDAVDTECP